MELLCHRGLWERPDERNSLASFRAAWSRGWGLETDLRDRDGSVVVSHDPATASALPFCDFLTEYARHGGRTRLALNVKADGLAPAVAAELLRHEVCNAFVFDMSVPDHLTWSKTHVKAWTRWSDVEPAPVLLDSSPGVWLDAFEDDAWWSADDLRRMSRSREVCVVSPELHGRDPRTVWSRLRGSVGVSLCTDRAPEVEKFFL